MYTIQNILTSSSGLINKLIGVGIALAVLVFFWGIVKFIFKAGDEKSHEEGRNRMIWGIIALLVLTSIWGIVNYIRSDFGIGGTVQNISPCGINPGPCF